jgi:orotate phosphoribosyltransferase
VTPPDLFGTLPARRGHFLLESGLHTDVWLTLDALFVDPSSIVSMVAALAARLRPYEPSAVCGPFIGGAFLAQALAMNLGTRFFYAERQPDSIDRDLFKANYDLPRAQRQRVRGQRVALVDDVISAGSSVRAVSAALDAAGASTVVVASLLTLGTEGISHFAARGVPFETLDRRAFPLWKPEECPLCHDAVPLTILP